MTIQQLKYAITISEVGSLNRASEVLYVSQPSLSSAVRSLEEDLGITIFSRGGKGVALTNDGAEFIRYARQVVAQYERLLDKYGQGGTLKKKFGISTQHYSFAVKSFVEMVKQFDTQEYEFAIRETTTRDVIEDVSTAKSEIGILYLSDEDVSTAKSEIGILYLSDFNRKAIERILRGNQLEFHPLIQCDTYAYLWKGHPLAGEKTIRPEQLAEYPCLTFEQGGSESFYFNEETLANAENLRIIKATDRASMLNLMVGLNGYTVCSGIICEELNGSDYVAVPFRGGEETAGSRMEIGYIIKQNMIMSNMAQLYIEELKRYLGTIPANIGSTV